MSDLKIVWLTAVVVDVIIDWITWLLHHAVIIIADHAHIIWIGCAPKLVGETFLVILGGLHSVSAFYLSCCFFAGTLWYIHCFCSLLQLIRPPGTLVPEGLMFYCRCFLGRPNVSSEGFMFYPWCFFLFLSPGYLRAPSADRRETLPHDRNMKHLYNVSPKIRGALPPKKLGAKNMQNSARFQTTSNFDREYLRNESRYQEVFLFTYRS